jgi:hypothetical protein
MLRKFLWGLGKILAIACCALLLLVLLVLLGVSGTAILIGSLIAAVTVTVIFFKLCTYLIKTVDNFIKGQIHSRSRSSLTRRTTPRSSIRGHGYYYDDLSNTSLIAHRYSSSSRSSDEIYTPRSRDYTGSPSKKMILTRR